MSEHQNRIAQTLFPRLGGNLQNFVNMCSNWLKKCLQLALKCYVIIEKNVVQPSREKCDLWYSCAVYSLGIKLVNGRAECRGRLLHCKHTLTNGN